jgi:hypothetical protein
MVVRGESKSEVRTEVERCALCYQDRLYEAEAVSWAVAEDDE